MQYPVPQFTDVEDKLIGSLTFKQFGIIFGVGVIIFLFYSATKSVAVLVIAILLLGIPAIGIAFGRMNGRPMYTMLPHMLKFFTAPRYLVFHKEVRGASDQLTVKDAEMKAEVKPAVVSSEEAKRKLEEVNRMLQQQSEEERELIKRL